MQVLNPRHQARHEQWIANPGTPMQNILVEKKTKKSDGNVFMLIFLKGVQGQKHPRR